MPVAQVPSKSYSLLEGEALAILCRMPGKPAQITWSKLSGTLPPYAQSKDGQLLIDKVKLSDAGIYRCTATDDDIEDDRKRNATTDVMVDIRGGLVMQDGILCGHDRASNAAKCILQGT